MPDTSLPPTEQDPSLHPTHESPLSGPSSKTTITPTMALGTVIAALLVLLMMLKFRPANDGHKSGDTRALASLQAELEELKRQSGALGVPALGGGEQMEDVTSRIKKDADNLVLLASRYKQLLDDANGNLVKKNNEWRLSEQYRQLDRTELERVKNELQQAKASSTDIEPLRREVTDLKTRRDAQATEIATLKQQISAVGEQSSKADMDTLQRRFEETLRAKEFFESRSKELEAELAKLAPKEPTDEPAPPAPTRGK